MTIAGIKPKYVELYTADQVHEILIKFANSVSVIADWDYNWEEELELIGYHVGISGVEVYGDVTISDAVDVFIKGE